jgi:hypothetical protein
MSNETKGAVKWPHLVQGAEGWRRKDDSTVVDVQGGDAEYSIIADTDTNSPLKHDGKAVHFVQIRTLLIRTDNGPIELYGCAHCDYVRENVNAIRPHLSRHNRKRATNDKSGSALPDISLADAMQKLGEMAWLREQMDGWKTRALKAERELDKLRRAFKSLGES